MEKEVVDPCGGGFEKLGHLVPGGYEYRNLALQVGRVSQETVKYGLKRDSEI
jgi:hypothetical protein